VGFCLFGFFFFFLLPNVAAKYAKGGEGFSITRKRDVRDGGWGWQLGMWFEVQRLSKNPFDKMLFVGQLAVRVNFFINPSTIYY
jgi:hypothetical protein